MATEKATAEKVTDPNSLGPVIARAGTGSRVANIMSGWSDEQLEEAAELIKQAQGEAKSEAKSEAKHETHTTKY